MERNDTKKAEIKEELVQNYCVKFLTRLNEVQRENGGDYLASTEMTWADIFIAEFLGKLESTLDTDILKEYEYVRKTKEAVESNPNIKEWLNNRPRDWFVKGHSF